MTLRARCLMLLTVFAACDHTESDLDASVDQSDASADAGSSADSGTSHDAGFFDAGSRDAGSHDAGATPRDAGTTPDAGADGGSGADAGTAFDGGASDAGMGATLLAREGFESGIPSTCRPGVASESTVVRTGSRALRHDASQWGECFYRFTPHRRVYVSFWVNQGTAKAATYNHYWRLSSVGRGGDEPWGDQLDFVASHTTDWYRIAVFGHLDAASCVDKWLGVGDGTPPVPADNAWHRIEIYADHGTNAADGFVRYWEDGISRADYRGVKLACRDDAWSSASIPSNEDAASSDLIYFDDVEIWDRCPPGSACAGE